MSELMTSTAELENYVETYRENGAWKSRRHDSDEPFSTSASKQREITAASEVARWNQVPHIIRNADGTIAEINTYGARH